MKFIFLLDSHNAEGVPHNNNYDPNGTPLNNDLFLAVSNEFLDDINSKLPESVRLPEKHPDWLKDGDIHIIEDNATVDITFIDEGAGYLNGIGYYIYETNDPPRNVGEIKVTYVIFPNCSKEGAGGGLHTGDTVRLSSQHTQVTLGDKHIATPTSYTFNAGQSIGFVMFVNAYRTYKNSMNCQGHKWYSNHKFNSESTALKQHHTVLIQSDYIPEYVIMGWEDLHRNAQTDDDFNDAILALKVTPATALDGGNVNKTEQSTAKGTILCDDQLFDANYTDNDYSDAIIEYDMTKTISGNNITGITGVFHLKHRSALFDHRFGLKIPNLSNYAATIQRETFYGDSNESLVETVSATNHHLTIIDSTKTLLPPSANSPYYANTHPNWDQNGVRTPVSSVKISIVFNQDVPLDGLGTTPMPFVPYLHVYRSGEVGVNAADSYYIYSDRTYRGKQQLNVVRSKVRKILVIPNKLDFQCAHERTPLVNAYPNLQLYIESDTQSKPDWYLDARDRYLNPTIASPNREWSI